MDFLRAVSIILVVMNVYWFCYAAIRLWGVAIGVVDRIPVSYTHLSKATVMSASLEMMQPCSTASSGNLFSSVVILDVFLMSFLPFVAV